MKIELSKIKEKDYKEVAEIYMVEFSKPPFNEPWTLDKAVEKLRFFIKYCDVWVIFFESELAGFIAVNPNQWCSGEILFGEEMAIKEELQRKGIGKEVFKRIFEIYKNKGFKNYMGIVNKGSKSYSFHEKIGTMESSENVVMGCEI